MKLLSNEITIIPDKEIVSLIKKLKLFKSPI